MFCFNISDFEVLLIKPIVEVNAIIKNAELTKKEREAGGVQLGALLNDDTPLFIFKRTEGNGDFEFTTITPF